MDSLLSRFQWVEITADEHSSTQHHSQHRTTQNDNHDDHDDHDKKQAIPDCRIIHNTKQKHFSFLLFFFPSSRLESSAGLLATKGWIRFKDLSIAST